MFLHFLSVLLSLSLFVLSDLVSLDLDQYDVVSLTDALRGFLQDTTAPIIPATVYSELVYTAQGTATAEGSNSFSFKGHKQPELR